VRRSFASRRQLATRVDGAEQVTLRDGSPVSIRPVRSQDEPSLHAFLSGLCPEARRLRFFSGAVNVARAAQSVASIAGGRYGLVACDRSGVLVGHALFVPLDGERAEVAVEVADRLHGRGLGTILIERLAATAEARGIKRFIAEVLPDNTEMLDVFRDGFDARLQLRDGVDTVVFSTAAWRHAHDRFRPRREAGRPGRARARALRRPSSAPAR
jgi:L-amino acid N-acyltransferase YncA